MLRFRTSAWRARKARGSVSGPDGATCTIFVILGGILLWNLWDTLAAVIRTIGVALLVAVAVFGIWLEASGQTTWPKYVPPPEGGGDDPDPPAT